MGMGIYFQDGRLRWYWRFSQQTGEEEEFDAQAMEKGMVARGPDDRTRTSKPKDAWRGHGHYAGSQ